jgi:hypothetical protein
LRASLMTTDAMDFLPAANPAAFSSRRPPLD